MANEGISAGTIYFQATADFSRVVQGAQDALNQIERKFAAANLTPGSGGGVTSASNAAIAAAVVSKKSKYGAIAVEGAEAKRMRAALARSGKVQTQSAQAAATAQQEIASIQTERVKTYRRLSKAEKMQAAAIERGPLMLPGPGQTSGASFRYEGMMGRGMSRRMAAARMRMMNAAAGSVSSRVLYGRPGMPYMMPRLGASPASEPLMLPGPGQTYSRPISTRFAAAQQKLRDAQNLESSGRTFYGRGSVSGVNYRLNKARRLRAERAARIPRYGRSAASFVPPQESAEDAASRMARERFQRLSESSGYLSNLQRQQSEVQTLHRATAIKAALSGLDQSTLSDEEKAQLYGFAPAKGRMRHWHKRYQKATRTPGRFGFKRMAIGWHQYFMASIIGRAVGGAADLGAEIIENNRAQANRLHMGAKASLQNQIQQYQFQRQAMQMIPIAGPAIEGIINLAQAASGTGIMDKRRQLATMVEQDAITQRGITQIDRLSLESAKQRLSADKATGNIADVQSATMAEIAATYQQQYDGIQVQYRKQEEGAQTQDQINQIQSQRAMSLAELASWEQRSVAAARQAYQNQVAMASIKFGGSLGGLARGLSGDFGGITKSRLFTKSAEAQEAINIAMAGDRRQLAANSAISRMSLGGPSGASNMLNALPNKGGSLGLSLSALLRADQNRVAVDAKMKQAEAVYNKTSKAANTNGVFSVGANYYESMSPYLSKSQRRSYLSGRHVAWLMSKDYSPNKDLRVISHKEWNYRYGQKHHGIFQQDIMANEKAAGQQYQSALWGAQGALVQYGERHKNDSHIYNALLAQEKLAKTGNSSQVHSVFQWFKKHQGNPMVAAVEGQVGAAGTARLATLAYHHKNKEAVLGDKLAHAEHLTSMMLKGKPSKAKLSASVAADKALYDKQTQMQSMDIAHSQRSAFKQKREDAWQNISAAYMSRNQQAVSAALAKQANALAKQSRATKIDSAITNKVAMMKAKMQGPLAAETLAIKQQERATIEVIGADKHLSKAERDAATATAKKYATYQISHLHGGRLGRGATTAGVSSADSFGWAYGMTAKTAKATGPTKYSKAWAATHPAWEKKHEAYIARAADEKKLALGLIESRTDMYKNPKAVRSQIESNVKLMNAIVDLTRVIENTHITGPPT